MNASLWDNDEPVKALDLDVPAWIAQDITPSDVAAIVQGGCASGAYMPAVTYYDALATMSEHGDAVLQYVQDIYGELPRPKDDESWAGMAVHYLSCAVELWAGGAEAEIREALDAREMENV